ncbi:MAG: cyclic nucleotide-binding domain-containing protein [Tatlockia sp.]|jgi:CRP-like cAMP-binding protein
MDNIIEKNEILHALSAQELAMLEQYLYEISYQKKEIILKQGSRGGDLYILRKGRAQVMVSLPGDNMKLATTLTPGTVFGEVAFLTEAPITATIVAEEAVTCAVLKKEILQMLRIAAPLVAFKIEKAIALQAADKIITSLERARAFLKNLPEEVGLNSNQAHFWVNPKAKKKAIKVELIDSQVLANMQCFRGFSPEERAIVLSKMKAFCYDKGYYITPSHVQAGLMSLICSGATMLFLKDEEKLIKSIAVCGIGQLFFEDSRFSEVAHYVSCEECVILEISLDAYEQLSLTHPKLFYAFSQFVHSEIVAALYIVNRQFVRINTEYRDLLS